MNPMLNKINKDLNEFLNTVACKDYFLTRSLVSSINKEKTEREIFKSTIRAASYSQQTRAAKRQKLTEEKENEEVNEEVENEEIDEDGDEGEEEDIDDNEESESSTSHHLHKQTQQHHEKGAADTLLQEEHLTIILGSLDADESFDSLLEQDRNSSTLNYLNGKGNFTWNSNNNDSSILQKLMKFRKTNIIGAQNSKMLNDIRVLSLSFIFVFGHTFKETPRLCEYLDIEDCSSSCQQADIPDVEELQIVVSDLMRLQKAYFNNIHNLDNVTFTSTGTTGIAQSIITNMYNSLITWNNSPFITECQFSEQAIFPLILPLFARCRDFEISKYDRTMIGMNDYKPDLLIILKLKFNISIDFFICEIKKPNCSSNKYESDFVKTQREMKAIIDSQIELGIDEPTCYALLVERYDCYIYKMSLVYDAEYRSNLITQFRTLRDPQDIMLLLPAINAIVYLNGELARLKSDIMSINRSRKEQSSKASYRRPSFTKAINTQ